MPLSIGRRQGEGIRIVIPPSTEVQEIELCVSLVKSNRARLAFKSDKSIKFIRNELQYYQQIAGPHPEEIRS